MRIQTNVESLNAYRNLSETNRQQSTHMERLSSGFRINRAADDAAGLAISEQMRGQFRGLDQATENAQDSTSLIQTAEGALEESHQILQRMRELSVQSANDTLTPEDRAEIQEEVNQLAEELNRIAEDTEYNTMELLDGSFEAVFHIGANEGQNMEIAVDEMSAGALGVEEAGDISFAIEGDTDVDSDDVVGDTMLEESESYELDVQDFGAHYDVDGEGEYARYGLTNEDGEVLAVSEDGEQYNFLEEAVSMEEIEDGDADIADADTYNLTFDEPVTSDTVSFDVSEEQNGSEYDIENIEATATIDLDNDLSSGTYEIIDGGDIDGVEDDGSALIREGQDAEADNVEAVSDGDNIYHADDVDISDDTDWGDADPIAESAEVDLHELDELDVTAEGGIDVSNQLAADSAITTIDEAIETVSSERSELGAVQNRLDHTVSNLEVASENLQAAESRIRDTDMAAEMTEFTTTQILEEAGTAMLAQANQAPQNVLQLLG